MTMIHHKFADKGQIRSGTMANGRIQHTRIYDPDGGVDIINVYQRVWAHDAVAEVTAQRKTVWNALNKCLDGIPVLAPSSTTSSCDQIKKWRIWRYDSAPRKPRGPSRLLSSRSTASRCSARKWSTKGKLDPIVAGDFETSSRRLRRRQLLNILNDAKPQMRDADGVLLDARQDSLMLMPGVGHVLNTQDIYEGLRAIPVNKLGLRRSSQSSWPHGGTVCRGPGDMRPIGLSHPVGKASDAMSRAFGHCQAELVGGLAVALDIAKVPPELRQLVLLWITGFTQSFEEPLETKRPLTEWANCWRSWPRHLRVSALWAQRFLPICRVTAARATFGRLRAGLYYSLDSSGLTNNGLQKELLDRLRVCELISDDGDGNEWRSMPRCSGCFPDFDSRRRRNAEART